MLFINNHQAKVREPHLLLNQCMGADRDLRSAGLQLLQRLVPVFCLPAASQKHCLQPHCPQQGDKIQIVLFGQNFGRDHQRRLAARSTSHHKGMQRHDGLPGPDITLHQAIHRPRGHHVGLDLTKHTFLRGGQRKGKDLRQLLQLRHVRIKPK